MERVVVVGCGASGVHFALTALKMGRRVLMIDVGGKKPPAVNPGDDFNTLKSSLADPVQYFLGPKYEALILPGHNSEYYGFPPSKKYIFSEPPEFRYRANGFAPLFSFAAGGLAEAWTGGCYPFRDEELSAFPFSYRDIEPCYQEVAERIGITGAADDLARVFPLHGGLMEPLDLDEHSERLLRTYKKHREYLNRELGCFIGRSRVAALSRDLGSRKSCTYSGRCLWGCPSESLYTPSITLRECLQYAEFEYLGNCYASNFRFTTDGRVTKIVAVSVDTGATQEIEVGKLVLAAGALSSAKLLLDSIHKDSGEIVTLRGLMDNRQILMPFVNLGMIGKQYNPQTYQYHQVAIGLAGEDPMSYVHGLVTTLKTALIHPIVQSIPFDFGTATSFFRHIHAALGLVNINFSDYRRDENCLTIEPAAAYGGSRLMISYRPAEDEPQRLRSASKAFRKILWKLGCIAPPPMTHVRPMGASVHYAGVIPMTGKPARFTCSPVCQSHDFENLYFADGITFPALPAKNLTFTLMANAVRVARAIL